MILISHQLVHICVNQKSCHAMLLYLSCTLTLGLLEFLPWTALFPAGQLYVGEEWQRKDEGRMEVFVRQGIKINGRCSSLTYLWIQLFHIQTSQEHRSGSEHVLPPLALQAQTLTPSSKRRAHLCTHVHVHLARSTRACVRHRTEYLSARAKGSV